jgi:hypothetical protein
LLDISLQSLMELLGLCRFSHFEFLSVLLFHVLFFVGPASSLWCFGCLWILACCATYILGHFSLARSADYVAGVLCDIRLFAVLLYSNQRGRNCRAGTDSVVIVAAYYARLCLFYSDTCVFVFLLGARTGLQARLHYDSHHGVLLGGTGTELQTLLFCS